MRPRQNQRYRNSLRRACEQKTSPISHHRPKKLRVPGKSRYKDPPSCEGAEQQDLFPLARPRRLPNERKSITHKFWVGSHEGYLIVGTYEEGAPGEVFIKMAKEGSMLSGFMDGVALSISIGLQYGVPLRV